jgi:hypothetical protein
MNNYEGKKQVKVINTYFVDGINAPNYELEDGRVITPVLSYSGRMVWMTETEFDNLRSIEEKERNKPSIKNYFK